MTDLERIEPRLLTLLVALSTPLGLFALLVIAGGRYDPVWAIPVPHFWMVSAASGVALLLSGVIAVASVRSREPRTLAVAAGFLSLAGIFAVHGLTTPGSTLIVHEMHHSIVVSARLSLFVGAIFFLIASFDTPPAVKRYIRRKHGALLTATGVLVAGYIAANLLQPSLLDFVPTGTSPRPSTPAAAAPVPATSRAAAYDVPGAYEPATAGAAQPAPAPSLTNGERAGQWLGYGLAVFATVAFAIAGYRFARAYPYTRSILAAAMAAAMLLLAQAQIVMALGTPWQASWWLYHVLMLAGLLIPVAALGIAARRGSDLGEIVEGLFLRDLFGKLEVAFPEAIDELVLGIERKDPYLRGHMRRVCQLSHDIAAELGVPEQSAHAASFGGLLHDIGKFGIPDAVLHKPGRLSDDEFAVMKEHPDRGHRLVAHLPRLRAAVPAVRWHHERLDGSGYPDRLTGDAIPIEARIVAVADVWDAMTSDRVYREAMNPERAREIIARESGTTLDPACVDALFAVLARRGYTTAKPTMSVWTGDLQPAALAG